MKENIRSIFIVAAMLLLAALVFSAVGTAGKSVESRFGLIAIAVIAVLLFSAVFLPEKTSSKTETKNEKPNSRVRK